MMVLSTFMIITLRAWGEWGNLQSLTLSGVSSKNLQKPTMETIYEVKEGELAWISKGKQKEKAYIFFLGPSRFLFRSRGVHVLNGLLYLHRIKTNLSWEGLEGVCETEESQQILWTWSPQSGEWGVGVQGGMVEVPCFDFDEKRRIQAKQGAILKIEKLDSGELVFDWLPSGKKLIRGEWTSWDHKKWWPKLKKVLSRWEEVEKEQSRRIRAWKEQEERRRRLPCQNPPGDYNTCMLRRNHGGVCEIYRCTAQGSWDYPIPLSPLESQELGCDQENAKVITCPKIQRTH